MSITGLEDKRQITALLSCTMSSTLLPPQILYQGKTDQCHPNAQFPSDWDIFHTENHWSNEQSMLRFVDTIISPYINETRYHRDITRKITCQSNLQADLFNTFNMCSNHTNLKVLNLTLYKQIPRMLAHHTAHM